MFPWRGFELKFVYVYINRLMKNGHQKKKKADPNGQNR